MNRFGIVLGYLSLISAGMGAQGCFADSFRASFSYRYPAGGFTHLCQGTLVFREKNVCIAATAAHCLEPAMTTGAVPVDRPGAFRKELALSAEALGALRAEAYVDKRYYRGYSTHPTAQDVGALVWTCNSVGDVPVVPLSDRLPRDEARVWYATVMSSRGLYAGTVFHSSGFHDRLGNLFEDDHLLVREDSLHLVAEGDSGGGLFTRDRNGGLALVGVLSLHYPANEVTVYNVGQSLDFVRAVAKSFGLSVQGHRTYLPPSEERAPSPVLPTEKSSPLPEKHAVLLSWYRDHLLDRNGSPGLKVLDEILSSVADRWQRVFFLCLKSEAELRYGYIDRGLDDLLASRAIVHDTAMAYTAMSAFFFYQGDYDLSLIWANKAITQLPRDGFAVDLRESVRSLALVRAALALLHLGRYREAASTIKSIKIFSTATLRSHHDLELLWEKGYLSD